MVWMRRKVIPISQFKPLDFSCTAGQTLHHVLQETCIQCGALYDRSMPLPGVVQHTGACGGSNTGSVLCAACTGWHWSASKSHWTFIIIAGLHVWLCWLFLSHHPQNDKKWWTAALQVPFSLLVMGLKNSLQPWCCITNGLATQFYLISLGISRSRAVYLEHQILQSVCRQ